METVLATRPGMAILVLLLTPLFAGFAQQNQTVNQLETILNPDGSLRLGKEFQGSFQTNGYRLELGPRGEPRFRPASAQSASATSAIADTADIHWDHRFVPASGFNGWVKAILVDSGSVYFGGNFTAVGWTAANSIVKWDGVAWSSLGVGISGIVLAISKFHNAIYVGGRFGQAGGAPASNLAKWDGNTWSTLGVYPNDGVYDEVRAILPLRDSLYIAGYFDWNGDTTKIDGLAIWNGTSIFPMPGHDVSTFDLYALASDGVNLYVGGFYLQFLVGAQREYALGVAKWDGNSWSLLGTPGHSGVRGRAFCMTWANGSLYVGGEFDSAGFVGAKNVARWDGANWTSLGAGLNQPVRAMSFSNGKLFAGGEFTLSGTDTIYAVGSYDTTGGTWSRVSNGVAPGISSVWALAPRGASLLVGGFLSIWINSFGTGNGSDYYAASFSGGVMTPLGVTSQTDGIYGYGGSSGAADWYPQQVNTIGANGDLVYVGGNFSIVGTMRVNNIACWNNSTKTWSQLGTGVNGAVISIALDGSDVYAGGLFDIAGGTAVKRIARWDGASWHPLGTPPNDGIQWIVTCLRMYSGNLYAGGAFTVAGGVSAVNVARWNGSVWNALSSGVADYVMTMDVFHDELYVGGVFTQAGGAPANYLAKWDGVSWKTIGISPNDGMNGPVHALRAAGEYLYAGGQFTTAGTTTANRIARWNGSSWSPLGPGFNGTVRAITTSGGSVYAGGDFTASGLLTANHIARWDSTSPTWAALGGGTNLGIFAIENLGNDLFAGGRFTVAGGKGSSLFGRWNRTLIAVGVASDRSLPASFELSQNYPNPFNPVTTISYQVPANVMVTLIVYDLLGREVETLVNQRQPPGRYDVRMDATALASGVYFYRFRAGDFVQTKKFLLLR